MNSQLSLPGLFTRIGTPTRVRDTSRAAMPAASKKSTDQERIYQYIESCEPFGATDEQGQRALDMQGDTYRPRRGELAKAGRIRQDGKRETSSGKLANVWRVVG